MPKEQTDRQRPRGRYQRLFRFPRETQRALRKATCRVACCGGGVAPARLLSHVLSVRGLLIIYRHLEQCIKSGLSLIIPYYFPPPSLSPDPPGDLLCAAGSAPAELERFIPPSFAPRARFSSLLSASLAQNLAVGTHTHITHTPQHHSTNTRPISAPFAQGSRNLSPQLPLLFSPRTHPLTSQLASPSSTLTIYFFLESVALSQSNPS